MEETSLHLDNDTLAAYAVDGLSIEETAGAAMHLDRCVSCRQKLATLRETAALLPYGLAMAEPPPELRDQILTRARASRQPAAPPAAERRRRLQINRWAAAFAAVCAVAGFLLGRNLPAATPDLQRAAGARVAALSGQGAGNFVVAPGEGRIRLTVSGLPSLEGDKVYQLWLMGPDGPISAGTFVLDGRGEGHFEIDGIAWSPGYSGVAITPEPRGGRPAPSGAIVAKGTF